MIFMDAIKTQRIFLLVIGLGVLGFVGMALLFGQAGATNTYLGGQNALLAESAQKAGAGGGEVQEVYIKALSTGGYDKSEITVRKGVPVRLHFSAEKNAGCGKVLLMQKFGVRLVSGNGEEQVAEFTPTNEGTFDYSCSMYMFRGKLRVVP